MATVYTLLFLLLATTCANAQFKKDTLKTNTTHKLKEVLVRGYLSAQPAISVPASVSVIGQAQIKLQQENSLVSTINTVPGVRMEERTPGSYRLSIRGSLLRSPFGVRDVKVYYDELPLTDAGGNTYLNAIDFNSVKGIEVLKGPDGSLFGANSGGVVIINPASYNSKGTTGEVGINAGSYALVHEHASVSSGSINNQFSFNQAYQTYRGYREHSYMQRHYIQAANKWQYATSNSLKVLGFYSDLNYQTPGGLTLVQYNANPALSRQATPTLPSAIAQNIGVTTRLLFGGLVNETRLNTRLRNVAAIFGNHTYFSNPFITNYEERNENTFGVRTYFEYSGIKKPNYNWNIDLGLEWSQTNADINNYGNHGGMKDTTQTADRINTNQHFFFTRYATDFFKRLHTEAALSLNYYSYQFKNIYPLNQQSFIPRNFSPQLMPRLALSYQITDNFTWRASISRGYSTPTTAEIRPTNNIINRSLNAQFGVNYETGFRLRDKFDRFMVDASVFYYRLNNAIVRQLNTDETEYYINAGGTKQPGFEFYSTAWIIRQNTEHIVRGLQISESLTLSDFTFANYNVAGVNYSGNALTGVPKQVSITDLQLLLPKEISVYVQHNYTSGLPLNDANSVYADHYNLLQAKASWTYKLSTRNALEVDIGADNLLNQKYSLGNDLNAVGNRYYNAAPLRNYFIGVNVRF
ncbi:TonB-dependent receptor [Mucilaginibacter ginkgonis]|uniref:TonB-dependent receptor n=1 Tax=Mucilaginibacter ginkgonis TaxID=2682091 RepID=A0A6I4I081_9SPHI|nr:TonB-dependent receptor [Mucilaginibacter ginkgonis]QQL48316.1 TonB-dependent receptor [Mucilaginibacter ginkgonis]